MAAILLLGIASVDVPKQSDSPSPYVGQELREIVSLSDTDLEALQAGSGVAFQGMAKLAELNGYPGPKHVLELQDDLSLSSEQQSAMEELFGVMQSAAVPIGERIIEEERKLDESFKQGLITSEQLSAGITESARLYADLRNVHLQAHLATVGILTEEQVDLYNELRGYTGIADPCENVPEGHDPDLWLLHHGCN